MEIFELIYKGKKISGRKIKEDEKTLTLKLNSGYNVSMEKNQIKDLKIIETISDKEKDKITETKTDKTLPKILIIHTGGTIASKVDYTTGAVSSSFTPEELLNLYPELKTLANIKTIKAGNLLSENMRFEHYNLLLDSIKENMEDDLKGIIISHGTDTLHYTSSALHYSIQNLNIPILLIGAQRSSDRPSSDAFSNLSAGIRFIIENSKEEISFRRVGICMQGSISKDIHLIIDGLNARKMHSSRRDAFRQINYKPYAKIENSKISILREELQTPKNDSKPNFLKYDTNLKIGIFKPHPHLNPEEIEILKIYDALIIEGTGLGHLGIEAVDEFTKKHEKTFENLSNLSKKIPLIMSVQTINGEVNMNIYSVGRRLLGLGILGNYMNLTTETLFMRVASILSLDKENFQKIWVKNLEGFEIRSEEMDF